MFAVVSSVALLLTFAVALISKVRSAKAFDALASGLREFGVRRRSRQRLLAAAVVLAEAAVIVLLALPMRLPIAARELPATLLLLAFSTAVGRAAARHGLVACHCFGSGQPARPAAHLVANLALIVLGIAAMVEGDSGGLTTGDRIFGVGSGLIIGVLAITLGPVSEALISSDPPAKERLPA